MEKQKIIADHHEKNSLVCSELVEHGIDVEFTHLLVADFLVGETAIERKTISDFLTSMMNKRLSKQLLELQQYDKRLLIIEGIEEQELYNDEPEGVHGNAIRGFLLSILLESKVPIIFTKDYKDTAKFLSVLAKKQKNTSFSIRAKKRNLSLKEQKQFILEGFPGIGPKTAKNLIKKHNSLKTIFNLSDEELQQILGKKSDVFKRIIN